jgi:hypothetical protein
MANAPALHPALFPFLDAVERLTSTLAWKEAEKLERYFLGTQYKDRDLDEEGYTEGGHYGARSRTPSWRERRVGRPLLFSPTAAQEAILKADFDEVVGLFGAGRAEEVGRLVRNGWVRLVSCDPTTGALLALTARGFEPVADPGRQSALGD